MTSSVSITSPSRRKMEQARAELDKAQDLFGKGKLDKAANVITALARQYPNYFAALYLAGMIFDRLGFPMEALTYLMRAHVVDARDRLTLEALGRLFTKMSDWQSAAWALEKAAEIGPADASLHVSLGDAWFSNGEYGKALKAYSDAHEMKPNSPAAAFGLAKCCEYMGNLGRAGRILEAALAHHPANAKMLIALARLPGRSDVIDVLERVEQLIKSAPANFDPSIASGLDFARAHELEKRERYEEAWSVLTSVNARRFTSLADRHKVMKNLRNLASADLAAIRKARMPPPEDVSHLPKLLMVIGPPRSGKTVLESLLSLHPDVQCGYENPIWASVRRRAAQENGYIPETEFMDLPDELRPKIRKIFESELLSRADGRKVVTTTNPSIIFFLGRIMRSLPNLRMAYMRRRDADLTFRIFTKNIKGTNTFAFDLDAIREHIAWCNEILSAVAADFPSRCCVVDYEAMVEDPKHAVEQALRLVGLTAAGLTVPAVADDRGYADRYLRFIERS